MSLNLLLTFYNYSRHKGSCLSIIPYGKNSGGQDWHLQYIGMMIMIMIMMRRRITMTI
jgi:hypothetical protein